MRNRILMTDEDLFAEILEDLAKEHPCEFCGDDGTTEAEHVANQYWHGVKVTCKKCGTITTELDDPEGGWL
jgi:hypothetical protein